MKYIRTANGVEKFTDATKTNKDNAEGIIEVKAQIASMNRR